MLLFEISEVLWGQKSSLGPKGQTSSLKTGPTSWVGVVHTEAFMLATVKKKLLFSFSRGINLCMVLCFAGLKRLEESTFECVSRHRIASAFQPVYIVNRCPILWTHSSIRER